MNTPQAVSAEVRVATRKDLPNDLAGALSSRLGTGSDIAEALQHTVYRNVKNIGSSVVYARLGPNFVYVVFSGTRTSFKVHIERRQEKRSLANLKRSAEEVAGHLAEFIRFHKSNERELTIQVSLGGDVLQTGAKLSWWKRVKKTLRHETASVLGLSVAAVLVSFLLPSERTRALTNGSIALVALILRSLLAATFQKSEFQYE